MQTMLEQVNEKRIEMNQQVSDTGNIVLKDKVCLRFFNIKTLFLALKDFIFNHFNAQNLNSALFNFYFR